MLPYVLANRGGGPGPAATAQPNGNDGGYGGNGGYGHDYGGHGPGNERGLMFGLVNAQGNVVIPLPDDPLGEHVSAARLAQGTLLTVNGQLVGTILAPATAPGLTPEETAYLQRTDLALLLAGGTALLVAVVMGVLLARTLTRPLQALTSATQRVASGQLGQEVSVRSGDEIGELATAFNQMSRELARAVQSRRQMPASSAGTDSGNSGGVQVATLRSTELIDGPEYGGDPVRISWSMAPSKKTSVQQFRFSPR